MCACSSSTPTPAGRAPTALARNGDQLVELDLPLLKRERLEPVIREEGSDFVVAAIDAKSGNADLRKIPNQLGRPQTLADDRFRSTPGKRFECAADHLDVLLRHRPRSISRWTAAFHAKQIAAVRPKHYSPSPAASRVSPVN